MLVLSRKVGETIYHTLEPAALAALAARGETLEIAVTVLRVDVNKVRLGIQAPRCVEVQREELRGRLQPAG